MANITGWGRGTWGQGAWNQAIPVVVTGVSATGETSNVNVWGLIVPSQTPNWSGITPSQTPNWTSLTPSQTPNWQETKRKAA